MLDRDITEVTKAHYINLYGDRINHLRNNNFDFERKYNYFCEQVFSYTTNSLEMFDKLFNAIRQEIVHTNTDKAIADFNRRWGSLFRKLNRTSKIWISICEIYYTAAIKKDPVIDSPEELRDYLKDDFFYGKLSPEYQLACAYVNWRKCYYN